MARRPAQIPLDDEPVDIDLDDLPTDDELEAVAALPPGDASPAQAPAPESSALAIFQTWVVLVVLTYCLVGVGVGLLFAFRGAAGAGLQAFTHPTFYLLMLFWPITLWQLFWNQF